MHTFIRSFIPRKVARAASRSWYIGRHLAWNLAHPGITIHGEPVSVGQAALHVLRIRRVSQHFPRI